MPEKQQQRILKSSPAEGARASDSGAESALDDSPVMGIVHRGEDRGGYSARSRGLFQQAPRRSLMLAPRCDSVGKGMCNGEESCFSRQADFLGRSGKRGERMVAVADGVGHRKGVELSLRDFEHGS